MMINFDFGELVTRIYTSNFQKLWFHKNKIFIKNNVKVIKVFGTLELLFLRANYFSCPVRIVINYNPTFPCIFSKKSVDANHLYN